MSSAKNSILGIIVLLLTLTLSNKTYAQSAPQLIGQQTFDFYDSARNRLVKTEVWYPTASSLKPEDLNLPIPFIRTPTVRNGEVPDKIYPLILLSHGTGGGRLAMEWFAIGLVQQGFIVAAVDHWGNTFDNKIPEYFLRYWERPQDISLALTRLLAHPAFGNAIDGNRVGAAGHSLGGYTVIALAGGVIDFEALNNYLLSLKGQKEATIPELPELAQLIMDTVAMEKLYKAHKQTPPLKDKRIKAVLAMAPAIGQGFSNKNQFDQVAIPVYIIGAENDNIAPIETNSKHYHQLISDSRYYLLKGNIGHYVFLNEANDALREEASVYFKDAPSIDRGKVHGEIINVAADFFKNLKD